MYLKVKAHPNSKKDTVVKRAEDSFEVFVRAKPVEGKANDAVLDLLSEFLKIPRSRLRLVRGAMAHNKLVERLD
ncbi:MAG TPA: DUF167 domain-containing protein [Candidatus Kryptobacter bacterium]|nr:DUF167 domain-containing protein [Candidatus Kryptobacter bacterium]